MSPDSVEGRLQRLEQGQARMQAQLEDQHEDLAKHDRLLEAFVRMQYDLQQTRTDERETRRLVEAVHRRMDEEKKERETLRADRSREERGRKLTLSVAFIAAAASLLSAIITAGVVLLH